MMDDDREERLSFSDLQFSTDDLKVDSKVLAADGKQNSFSSSSPSSSNHDFLGFFSEEWSNSNTSTLISSSEPENIIFCGKVIHTSQTNKTSNHMKKKTDSKNNKSTSSLSTSRLNSLPVSWRKKDKDDHVLDDQRRWKLASPSKSRWHVIMFGSGRRFIPTKMELSDIRRRQLRRSDSGEEEKIGGKRLSGLIRVLGCGGGIFGDEMMKGSLGYVPSC